jgi:ABC-type phosphate/phosphonate transport system substrate-binding protein
VATLTLTTYLGANTDPIAADLASRLGASVGADVRFDASRSWSDRRVAIDAGEIDLLWMCGLATVEAIDAGRLDNEIVAAPVFPDHAGPTYRSVIVGRPEYVAARGRAIHGARVAINERSSWSGFHALRLHRPDAVPGEVVESGSHAASLHSLLEDRADIAAIDETIWAWERERNADLGDLMIIDRTQSWPAPPFSIARRLDEDVRRTLVAALVDARPVGLERIVEVGDGDYDPIREGLRRSLAQPGW